MTDTPKTEANEFAKAYAAWLASRAAVAACDAVPEHEAATLHGEKKLADAMEAEQAAKWAFIRCPSQTFADLKTRAQFVQAVIADFQEHGTPTDNHHIIAVNLLASEILDSTFS
jgi:hypothetical protein